MISLFYFIKKYDISYFIHWIRGKATSRLQSFLLKTEFIGNRKITKINIIKSCVTRRSMVELNGVIGYPWSQQLQNHYECLIVHLYLTPINSYNKLNRNFLCLLILFSFIISYFSFVSSCVQLDCVKFAMKCLSWQALTILTILLDNFL